MNGITIFSDKGNMYLLHILSKLIYERNWVYKILSCPVTDEFNLTLLRFIKKKMVNIYIKYTIYNQHWHVLRLPMFRQNNTDNTSIQNVRRTVEVGSLGWLF